MQMRELGRSGLEVSAIGLGYMDSASATGCSTRPRQDVRSPPRSLSQRSRKLSCPTLGDFGGRWHSRAEHAVKWSAWSPARIPNSIATSWRRSNGLPESNRIRTIWTSDNLDDLLSFWSMTLEETRAAAGAPIEMIDHVDDKHLAGLKRLRR